jgi:hypothetical protein
MGVERLVTSLLSYFSGSQEKGVENFILLKLHVRVSRGMGVES